MPPSALVPIPSGDTPPKKLQDLIHSNPFREQMPTTLMARGRPGTSGKPMMININSHLVTNYPTQDVYQFDVRDWHF